MCGLGGWRGTGRGVRRVRRARPWARRPTRQPHRRGGSRAADEGCRDRQEAPRPGTKAGSGARRAAWRAARAGGEAVDKEDLGGSRIHTRNGVVDDEVESEGEAFERVRRFLSYLPSSVYELAERAPVTDDPGRTDDFLLDAVPRDRRQVYQMRSIIDSVVDQGSFFEMGRAFGRSAICGLARLDGWPIALMAGDPYHYGGGWTAKIGRAHV